MTSEGCYLTNLWWKGPCDFNKISSYFKSIFAHVYIYIYIYIYIYVQNALLLLLLLLLLLFTPLEFFASVLTDDFTMEFKWQQVSSSLQDSSQISGRS